MLTLFLRRVRSRVKTSLRRRRQPPSTFIVSFPKCGRTWLHVMIGSYLVERYHLTHTDFLSLADISRAVPSIPPIITLHDDQPHKRDPRELVRSKRAYRRHKVLFLARDPRDVIVSKFYSLKFREKKYHLSLGEFLRDRVGSLATIVRYYNIWLEESKVHPAFMLVRYEDLHADPVKQLTDIIRFVDPNEVDMQAIQNAVAFAQFRNMRRIEDAGMATRPLLRPTEFGDYRTYKTRKGIVGDHANEFAAEDVVYADEYVKRYLNPSLRYS
jgi:hypothetical protein